ncbi:MAG: DUF975 family protein [Bacteroidales bacterium]|nr:DUF975 family protein [Bacteroidales bacterium]
MKSNREYRAQARAALKGNWSKPVLLTLLISLIVSGLTGSFSYVILDKPYFSVVSMLVTLPLQFGLVVAMLLFFRGQKENCVENGFRIAFKPFSTAFLVEFFKEFMVVLGLALLVVPGIILDMAYSMAEFIAYDEPEISPAEALRRSRRLMKGHKWQMFCLELSFIGWILLSCIFTLGIGLLWVVPYMLQSIAAFYEDLKQEAPVSELDA